MKKIVFRKKAKGDVLLRKIPGKTFIVMEYGDGETAKISARLFKDIGFGAKLCWIDGPEEDITAR